MVKYKGTEILTAIVEKNRFEICIVGRQDSLLGKKNINYFNFFSKRYCFFVIFVIFYLYK